MSACVSCLDTNPMTRSAGVCHSNAVLEMRWFSRLTLRNMLVAARSLVQDKAAHLREHGFVGKPHTIRRFPAQNRSQPVTSLTVMLKGSRLYLQCGFRILRPIVCPLTKMNCPTRLCTLSRWATQTEGESRGWLDTARMCSTHRRAWTRA